MRPVLLQLPSKLIFAAAILLAAVSLFRDVAARKRDPKAERSWNAAYLLAGAVALLVFRAPSVMPSAGTFSAPWQPIPIHSYGVMLGASMVIGWFLAMRLASNDGIPTEDAGAIYMWTAVWSILGARTLYVLTNLEEFADRPLDAFKIWQGGLVAYGGMIGGVLASWYGCRKRKIPLLRWADAAAPSVVLGTAITRIGCLLFGCDFGKRADVGWAITFPPKSPAWYDHVRASGLPETAARSFPVHPTQLYEFLVGLFLFGLLMFLRRVRRFSGQVFLGWVIGYGILRPIVEVYRGDAERGTVGPLSTSQFIGLTSVVLGAVLLATLLRRYRQDPAAMRLWEVPLPAAAAPAAPARRGKRR